MSLSRIFFIITQFHTHKIFRLHRVCLNALISIQWINALTQVKSTFSPFLYYPSHTALTNTGRVRLKPDGTRWRTGGELKGKLANGVGIQYSHTTSEHGVSSITNAVAHTSAASSRLNWRPRRFKWTRPFRRETKSDFCACAIRFQTHYTRFSCQLFCHREFVFSLIRKCVLDYWLYTVVREVAAPARDKVTSCGRRR